jgi:NADPH:quinone reductase-like Zn-dependent oxidoreductase
MSVQLARVAGDYTHQDVGEKLRDWAGSDGADVVHDTVGGKTFHGLLLPHPPLR